MIKLDECPCCGGEMMILSERTKLFYGWCTQCGLTSKRFTSKEKVAEVMNRRHEKTCHVEEHAPLKVMGIIVSHTYGLSCGHIATEQWDRPPAYCHECGAKVVEDD